MLAQFQSLYPNGSLISELVQIFQGKYIVRASVQIEGVTRATGMAAAETVEAAEDQARNRALMVLGITNAPGEPVTSTPKTISQVQIYPSLNTTGRLHESTYASTKDGDFVSSQWSVVSGKETSTPPPSERDIKPDLVTNDTPVTNKIDTDNQDLGQRFPVKSNWEAQFDTPVSNVGILSGSEPDNQSLPAIATSNVTPFVPRNYGHQEDVDNQSGVGKRKKKSEPVNLSDVIAKTDVEIERLGWTKEQGKEYLKKTYGKLGRSLLSEEELLDFLKHLESQPDPIAGF
ncbi:hypothetical protein Cylst_3814 [Cylindrospermum stagnale PCC 7417]|uniref:Uncharacterized protein n=1 Tax=Cylindrospermum stagnale PCC 7417 TaxID=56107 RepID=K9X2I4_9NOST|nr:hypothetical protein [Cylindrospermum stagnale]AFZ25932.1 hypothetical protein Cylst_3814 [Cylindrospermum stagnale PCC 7417]